MKKTILIIVLAALCLNFRALAQSTIHITGKVVDSANNKPLPGATIKIKSTRSSVSTDDNGDFVINTKEKQGTLLISFMGYKALEVNFTETNIGPFRIALAEDRNTLKEVSVISNGYQNIPKERATGSFAQPIKAEFDARVAPDILSKLNGVTSGLVFNSNTTVTQNGQLDINIRGRSTIFANDQPLIVVDNFPYSGDINNINPNDVESVTVLKDAASASIWGVRAGNGVIVITTKKGKKSQPLVIGFNSSLTVFAKPNLNYNPNQLTSSSYIGLEKYLFSQGYYDGNLNDSTNYPVISSVVQLLAAQRTGTISASDLKAQLTALSGTNINDQLSKYFYQHAVNQQYQINISGGSEKATHYFSMGYDNDLSSLKDNGSQRITINTQNTFFPVKNLEISVGLNAIHTTSEIDNTISQTQSQVFPYTKIADGNGSPLSIPYVYNQSYIQSALSNGFLDWSYTPLKELGTPDDKTKNIDIRFTTGLKYTFIKGLSGSLLYQYENSNSQNRDFESLDTWSTRNAINEYSVLTSGKVTGYNIPLGGILGLTNSNTIANNVRAQLNYNLDWSKNNLAILAGYELSETNTNFNTSALYGYNRDNATFTNVDLINSFPINPSGTYRPINSGLAIGGTLDRIRSTFANAAYSYDNKYIVSASARVDGSNYFGVATNKKSVPLWSIGGKWVINNEAFYKITWLPVLALRTTYGFNGNLDRSITGVTTFQYHSNDFNTNFPYASIGNVGNPDLQWEKTGITNLAIEFGTANNVISGSFEYYIKNETDLLGYKNFPENSGIASLEGNYSNMKGHGFDLSVTTRNLSGKFKWFTTFLFSNAIDKVTHYDAITYANQLVGIDGRGGGNFAVPVVGKPVFGIYSYKWGGLNSATGDPVGYLNGIKSEDYANINQNTPISDLIYSGPARPTHFGGFNNRFAYKGFSLNIQISYKFGYYFRKPTINYQNITGTQSSNLPVNRDYDNRWIKAGDETKTNVPSFIYPSSSARDFFYQYSSVNVDKGDNIRLQDATLSYDLNKSSYPHLPFNNLQLYLYANNIGILWRANQDGLDPDAIPAINDRQTKPNPTSISFGIKGTF